MPSSKFSMPSAMFTPPAVCFPPPPPLPEDIVAACWPLPPPNLLYCKIEITYETEPFGPPPYERTKSTTFSCPIGVVAGDTIWSGISTDSDWSGTEAAMGCIDMGGGTSAVQTDYEIWFADPVDGSANTDSAGWHPITGEGSGNFPEPYRTDSAQEPSVTPPMNWARIEITFQSSPF